MRLGVTGGRDYADVNRIWWVLDWFYFYWPVTILIHGAARGVDSICSDWATCRVVPQLPFPVTKDDWRHIGRRAGVLRNQSMIDVGRIDHLLAFHGGRGTQDMIQRCEKCKISITRVLP